MTGCFAKIRQTPCLVEDMGEVIFFEPLKFVSVAKVKAAWRKMRFHDVPSKQEGQQHHGA